MKCPNCDDQELTQKINLGSVEVDVCSLCGGMWFEEDGLRKAKYENDESIRWFDFDLWKDPKMFAGTGSDRMCPIDGASLHKLNYGDSNIEIEACKECNGIWLDKNEFEKIMEYVKEQADYEILHNYVRNLIQEGKEIVTGSEGLKSELADVLLLVKLFQYKFLTQHPGLSQVLINLPLTP